MNTHTSHKHYTHSIDYTQDAIDRRGCCANTDDTNTLSIHINIYTNVTTYAEALTFIPE